VGFLVMLVAVALLPGLARAGHYRLPIEGFVSPEEAELLGRAGIKTTLALLQDVATAAKRKRLVELTGLPSERIEALACQTDLMRIDGVGPTMARLLTAAGVRHARALAGEDAAALVGRMTAVNQATRIANVLPREGLVAAWVAAARRLPQVLDGLP
jgi:predicted flap endonuclease-1-like 5' DNA nuclease